MIQCVVFDFDGVLADSVSIKKNAYFEIFSHVDDVNVTIDKTLGEKQNYDRWGIINEILQELLSSGRIESRQGLLALRDEYAEKYNDICEKGAAECAEKPGVTDCLTELTRKYPLYINSATPEVPLNKVIAKRTWTFFQTSSRSPNFQNRKFVKNTFDRKH